MKHGFKRAKKQKAGNQEMREGEGVSRGDAEARRRKIKNTFIGIT